MQWLWPTSFKNEGGTWSYTLMQLTLRLLKWCDRKAITLVPVHLPGVHNVQLDSLSRVGQTLNTEWTMTMERLWPMFAKWGEPQVDLFATFANRRLIKFVSPYLDPRAEWTDAMSMPWDNKRGLLYAFPSFKMVPQVLQKIAQSPGVRVILTAQLQQAVSWFRELMDLSQEDPIPLFVKGQDLLTQDVLTGDGVTETRHFRPLNLHVWKLYGPFWGLRAIPGKLPTWCQGPYVNHHSKCTNPIGQNSWRSVGRKMASVSSQKSSLQQTSHLSVYFRRNPYFNHFLRGISVFGYYPYFSVFCINCRLINRNPQLTLCSWTVPRNHAWAGTINCQTPTRGIATAWSNSRYPSGKHYYQYGHPAAEHWKRAMPHAQTPHSGVNIGKMADDKNKNTMEKLR